MTVWGERLVSIVGLSAGILLAASAAAAQLNAEFGANAEASADADEGTAADAEYGAEGEAAETETYATETEVAPAAAPPPPPPVATETGVAVAAGQTDHEKAVGRLAIGYLGRRGMLMPGEGATVGSAWAEDPVEVQAPIIGVRYWVSDMIGIDAGLGLFMSSGSFEPEGGDEQDAPGATVFMLHGGVPLSLASSGHFSFQVVPELNFGFGSRTVDTEPEIEHSAMHFDVGVRAGAEVHFGFIDIPQLSLQGGVGLLYTRDSLSVEMDDTEDSYSTGALTTDVGGNPWNIFTSNISAFYYF